MRAIADRIYANGEAETVIPAYRVCRHCREQIHPVVAWLSHVIVWEDDGGDSGCGAQGGEHEPAVY